MLFRGIYRLLVLLQLVIGIAGFLLSALILGERINVGLQPFSAMFMAFILGVVSLCVHEGGHYLGAKWTGMTVLSMRVLAWEIQPLQRGWKARWSRRAKGQPLAGYVIAVHPPRQPLRRAMLVFTLMGPLLNLLVAGLCLALFALLGGEFAALVLALGVSNLATGLANLVPTVAPGRVSDGAGFLAWLCKPDERGQALANPRLMALGVAGTQAEDLPSADLEALSAQSMPAPLSALGYRLCTRQNKADWAGAVALGDELEAMLATHPLVLKPYMVLLSILRAELAFSRAMLERDARELSDYLFNEEIDWYAPSFRPRCLALRAAVAGDASQVTLCMEQAVHLARNSQDRSLGPREERLAGYIQALLTAPASSAALPDPVSRAAAVTGSN
ncbi:M50 family metallopeptidase [Pseudomonas putida]|uniref:M50 family metallopeptidase n=1 Tax=Pseudomonas putida TaxID=303 RepID=UPI00068B0003|nr:M50 family metallopeptidase [Pseudomonas putida]